MPSSPHPLGQPDLLNRTKDAVDNAEPSINGVSANNLFRLAALLNDSDYEKKANETLAAFAGAIRAYAAGYSGMMQGPIASRFGMGNLVPGMLVLRDTATYDGGNTTKTVDNARKELYQL